MNIMPFAFEDNLVRVVMQNDEPWFVGRDVCRVLELNNESMALSRLDQDEKGITTIDPLSKYERGGGAQQTIIISEPGVYRLTFTSRKPAAERFKRWLAHDVLPTLRKTGSYTFPSDAQMSDGGFQALCPEWLQLGTPAYGHALASVSEARRMYGREAARDLWISLGLPYKESYNAIATFGVGEGDSVSRFFRDTLERDETAPRIGATQLYRLYVDYCSQNKLSPESLNYFGKLVVRLGVRRRSTNGLRSYLGLRIKECSS